MFQPAPLHPGVAVGDAYYLPLKRAAFDLITCSNLLFMLHEPVQVLIELSQRLVPGGKLAMLNPSEQLNVQAAQEFAAEKKMDGIARQTLLTWASRAERCHRWSESETEMLYHQAGMVYSGSVLKVGPGFGRFSSGVR